jgi:hypothetical protein
MAFTNEQVAERFVRGLPGKGSNARVELRVDNGQSCGAFISYSTPVAYIRDGRLWVDTDTYSASTQRQLSYVYRAWRDHTSGKPDVEDPVRVPFIFEGGSRRNVEHYLHEAKEALKKICAPRIRMHTRIALWGDYLRAMGYADKLMALPNYGTSISPEFMAEKYDPVNLARAGLNPTGLGEFDNDMLLRVKAITALEGEGT